MARELVVGRPETLRGEIHEMCQQTVEMLRLTWEGFRKQDPRPLEPAHTLGREIHRREKALTELVVRAPAAPGVAGPGPELLFVPMHLERIGDNIEFLVRATQTMVREGVPFTERAMREINALFEKAIELMECVRDAVLTRNRVLVAHVLAEGQRYERIADEYALAHQQRLIEGVCMARASSVYLALLDYLKGIEWHTRQIAQRLSAAPPS